MATPIPTPQPGDDHPNSPEWFRDAIRIAGTVETVEVDGTAVSYLAWGEPGRPGLVFVHGGGAHAYWWAPVAARFAEEFRVAAIDLSGHGDSGRRDIYTLEQWTEEVVAVAHDAGMAPTPIVIGHSMGGFVSIATAARHGERLGGVIIVDSPVDRPDPEIQSFHLRQAFGKKRVYASIDDAVGRFRTIPAQANYLDYVLDYVARRSLRPVDGGFAWKFDDRIFEQFGPTMRGVALPYLPHISCRVALLRSEFGLINPAIRESMFEAMGRRSPIIELPEAGHHPMLDVPQVLLTALRSLVADWDFSIPTIAPPPALGVDWPGA